MSAWGNNGSARSCEALLKRVEANDPKLTELVVLPLKKFGSQEIFRLVKCLESGRNTHLRSLQASGHSIDDYTALEALGRALIPVESIAIGDSNMGDDGVCALCRGLESNERVTTEGNSGLKVIDMSWKNIGQEGLTAILRVLASVQSLQSIDLSRNENIGPSFDFWDTASSMLSLPSLPIFPGLTYLDLSECRLDAKSCTTLLKAMQDIGTDDEDEKEQQSTKSTAKTTRNLVLKLNSNNLSDPHHIKDMMDLLARGSLVSELYVSKCQIGDDGLKQIVDECCSSSKQNTDDGDDNDDDKSNSHFLHRLDLSHNNLTSVAYLANRLHLSAGSMSRGSADCHYFSDLRVLDLSSNPLGQNLMTAIECNVQWMSSLEELDISHTSCEIPGAVELIRRSNSRNSSLKKLNLFGNKLGNDGFLEVSKVLQGGHLSLEYLDLGGNGVTESGVVALLEALISDPPKDDDDENGGDQNTTEVKWENALLVLVVGGNKGGSAVEKVVKEVQKVHPDLDIARDKAKRNNDNGMAGGDMINNTPGTTWMS